MKHMTDKDRQNLKYLFWEWCKEHSLNEFQQKIHSMEDILDMIGRDN